jgi:Asp-tRNA(Asn)/Glu-tRNA(Gln) amidotransferase A subunit family amidase
MAEAYELTVTEGLKAMEAGKLTAEAWVASCLERIRDREQTVQAWEYLDRDGALARARELDKGGDGGFVAGVPFAAKDIIDTADMPTAYGAAGKDGHHRIRAPLSRQDAKSLQSGAYAGRILVGLGCRGRG